PRINKILGFSLQDFSLPADPEINTAIKSAMMGKVVIVKSLAEVLHPIISKRVCSAIQRLRGTKNYIVVPLKNKKEVVGGVFVSSSREDVTEEELEMIKSFAHAASNAIKNAQLHLQTKQAEELFRKQSAVLKAINEVFHQTLVCETEEEVARTCLSVARELTGSDFGLIGKVNDKGRFDTIAQSDTGWKACKIPKSQAILMIKDMEIRGIWGKALMDEQSLIVNDPASHPSRVGTPKGHPPIHSFLGVPMKQAGKTIGMIALANKKSGYKEKDKQAIEDLSVAFVEALRRKQAEEAVRKRKSQLELIHRIQNEIPMNVGIEAILKSAAESIGRSFGYHKVSVNLFDKDRQELVHLVGWNKSKTPTPRGHGQKIGEGLIGKAAELKETIIANDVTKEPSYVVYYQAKTKAELTIPLVVQDHLVGVLDIQAIKKNAFTDDDVSVLQSVASYIAYVIDEKQKEEVLRVSEEKYRNLIELSPDAIMFLDMKGKIISCNTFMIRGTGYSKEEIIGKHFSELELLRSEDVPKYVKLLDSVARGKVPKPFEVNWCHKDGTPYSAEVRISFIKEKGKKVGFQVVARDITERKKAEETIRASLREREVMLREIHHRVKNNMQIISSLLKLQSRQIKNKKILDMFNVGQNRIRSMALIHESLYQSRDLARINFSDYIKKLITHLFSIYRTDTQDINLNINVSDIFLDINRAIPCGLIINELVSNSLKHAFPEGKKGKISVEMNRNKGDRYTLVVRDTGIGFPDGLDFQNSETLGMQLVTALVTQLDGNIKLRRRDGTEFKIVF
ncbi:MAG: GAF domain-containing protein, partial [Candidatus Aminicenantales bacterium]